MGARYPEKENDGTRTMVVILRAFSLHSRKGSDADWSVGNGVVWTRERLGVGVRSAWWEPGGDDHSPRPGLLAYKMRRTTSWLEPLRAAGDGPRYRARRGLRPESSAVGEAGALVYEREYAPLGHVTVPCGGRRVTQPEEGDTAGHPGASKTDTVPPPTFIW